MAQKASIPKGTRDFLPTEVAKRNYVTDVIRTQFERYGFLPIQTPAMEKSSTLKGKYGEEIEPRIRARRRPQARRGPGGPREGSRNKGRPAARASRPVVKTVDATVPLAPVKENAEKPKEQNSSDWQEKQVTDNT